MAADLVKYMNGDLVYSKKDFFEDKMPTINPNNNNVQFN